MLGVAKFIIDKDTTLRFDFDDPRESFLVKGKFVHSEEVAGKQEMVALAMIYDEPNIPMGYKIRINEYMNAVRAVEREREPTVKQKTKVDKTAENPEENAETEAESAK